MFDEGAWLTDYSAQGEPESHENKPRLDHRRESEKLKDEGIAAGGASRSGSEHSH